MKTIFFVFYFSIFFVVFIHRISYWQHSTSYPITKKFMDVFFNQEHAKLALYCTASHIVLNLSFFGDYEIAKLILEKSFRIYCLFFFHFFSLAIFFLFSFSFFVFISKSSLTEKTGKILDKQTASRNLSFLFVWYFIHSSQLNCNWPNEGWAYRLIALLNNPSIYCFCPFWNHWWKRTMKRPSNMNFLVILLFHKKWWHYHSSRKKKQKINSLIP